MKSIITILLLTFSLTAFAQLGVNVRYQNMNSDLWKQWTKEADLFSNTYEIGLDYWFRLKTHRVEFMPEIYTSRSSTSSETENYNYNAYGLAANTNFYIFDFIGDCNCPTFSKDGNLFTKGFFLSVAPTMEYQIKKSDPGLEGSETSENLAFGISLGAGVDIGLTDLVTITPFVRYKFLPNSKWEGLAALNVDSADEASTTNLSFIQAGLRLGFRPDYVREQNKYKFRR